MIIGIDASSARQGGGLTYLEQMLGAAEPGGHGISKVIVWGGHDTLNRMPSRAWLELDHQPMLDRSLPSRLLWQQIRLQILAREHDCDLLFVPGGLYLGRKRPFVTTCQNMLPYSADERRRFGLSWRRLKYWLLRLGQSYTFRRAHGLMFLTEWARQEVLEQIGAGHGPSIVIAHGVNERFRRSPVRQRTFDEISEDRPFRWLYVSTINHYKHQESVVAAVARLRDRGIPVVLDLVGPAYEPALHQLERLMCSVDPDGICVRYHGPVPHSDLAQWYHAADGFVFASTCENLPIILLEAMASSLPIVSSNKSPMPEVLGDAGIQVDAEQISEIDDSMIHLMKDAELRKKLALAAHARASHYTWTSCAAQHMEFFGTISRDSTMTPTEGH